MRKKTFRTTHWLILAASLTMLWPAEECVAKDKKKTAAATTAPAWVDPLSQTDRLRYNYLFLEAVNRGNADDHAAAFDLLCRCVQIDPTAAEAYFLRSTYYMQMERDTLALRDLQQAAMLRPSNDTYQERLAQMYINNGNLEQATSVYEQLTQQQKDRGDLLNVLIQLYKYQKDYDKMLQAIDRLERVEGEDEQYAMARLNVYELQGDTKNARRVLKELADSHPNDMNYTVMLGNWLMQNDGKAEAGELFTKALEADPDNTYVQCSMYDYYKANGQTALAEEMLHKILLSKNTPSDNRVQFLRQAILDNEQNGGDSLKILSIFDRLHEAMPKEKGVAEMKVAYYALKHMPDTLQNDALIELLALSPDNGAARYQLIQNLWGEDHWQEVAYHSEMGMLYNPDEMGFYYFAGLARYYGKDEEAALNALKKATANIGQESDATIVSEIYAIMGEIYHKRDMMPEAYAAYDSCLHWKPDNIGTLNNYAYFLAMDDKDLKRAEAMSLKTIQAEPNNSTYLDTYAWVLYKEERYAEAKIYIDQALQNMADSAGSADIWEHAGDIYIENELGDEAVTYWQRAIEAGAEAKAMQRRIDLYHKKSNK